MNDFLTCTDIQGNQHTVARDELYWRPSAYGIVIRENRILLCNHYKRFNLPGGGIDFGESLEQGLIREIKEETGIVADGPRLIAACSDLFFPDFDEKPFQSVLLYYACEYIGGKLSVEGFDADEQIYAELAEWVDLDTIDTWKVTSTTDFRPFVKRALDLRVA